MAVPRVQQYSSLHIKSQYEMSVRHMEYQERRFAIVDHVHLDLGYKLS